MLNYLWINNHLEIFFCILLIEFFDFDPSKNKYAVRYALNIKRSFFSKFLLIFLFFMGIYQELFPQWAKNRYTHSI